MELLTYAMLTLIKLFFAICRLRQAPQDIPFSPVLQYASILTYIVTGYFISLINQTVNQAIATVTLDTVLMLALGYGGLWVRGFEARATQTITALAGTGTLFAIFTLPLWLWLQGLPPDQALLPSLFVNALLIWNIVVIGHILRHALTMPFWAGIGIALFYFIIAIRMLKFMVLASSGAAAV